MNIVMALASVLSVAFIVTTVVTVMVLMGWELGIAESVGIVILIGFSVDYVIHLSTHYIKSSNSQRGDRMRDSYAEMGGTITGGSITTLGSGVFLFFAKVSLFAKFAVLITSTICIAFLYSMFFFGSMMHLFGP
eukprot:CAMPEP_0205798904 /NCGR_PEP_ID=MMETSP0205-20121125/5_1 /ASSEMBLY_ACC=CAM_ASM_000278 /TAXON_ID=36767 /ORGANISM="Euplotes focardii, Strain TN1" /LENGTH=133 /DNA_ID=CAMNT_0053059343 /DNA_START=109 /DNA_END=510 /DNA_ORIENTATION=+